MFCTAETGLTFWWLHRLRWQTLKVHQKETLHEAVTLKGYSLVLIPPQRSPSCYSLQSYPPRAATIPNPWQPLISLIISALLLFQECFINSFDTTTTKYNLHKGSQNTFTLLVKSNNSHMTMLFKVLLHC